MNQGVKGQLWIVKFMIAAKTEAKLKVSVYIASALELLKLVRSGSVYFYRDPYLPYLVTVKYVFSDLSWFHGFAYMYLLCFVCRRYNFLNFSIL